MIGAINSGLSALNAMTAKMGAAAENVANLSTKGYKAAKVEIVSDGRGGVTAETTRDTSAGPFALDPDTGGAVEMSNVDLAQEMVGMMVTRRSYEANVKAIKTADEMLGTILDLRR